MRTRDDFDDRLIAPLLIAADRAPGIEDHDHPDEEVLALFAQGDLVAAERDEVIRHLAGCVACRKVASLVLSLPTETHAGTTVAPAPIATVGCLGARTRSRPAWVPVGAAAAASILLLVGGIALSALKSGDAASAERRAYARGLALLQAGDFDGARATVAEAVARGEGSDRLRSLDAQALRRMPAPLALACAGRLADFGYGIDGVMARGPAPASSAGPADQAYTLLAGAGSADLAVVLNRGHALLTLGRSREALAEFRAAAANAPHEPLAWLGQGLAEFALDDFPAAERAFRECLRLEPGNLAARMNLAMTLEEQGQSGAALRLWEALLAAPLPEADRAAILRAIEQLRQRP